MKSNLGPSHSPAVVFVALLEPRVLEGTPLVFSRHPILIWLWAARTSTSTDKSSSNILGANSKLAAQG